MACFLVPTGEAIITTIMTKAFQSKEKEEALKLDAREAEKVVEAKLPFSKKLSWLNKMLWGGSALLAFEHVWHGEVAPWFPFLTAMESADEAAAMLHEMSTVGVSMAVLVTAVWGLMVLITKTMEKREDETEVLRADTAEK
ncbi:MAG: hypothetical protein NC300_12175 [Bacteroidales bacterium]|nr:hypothetical protein [Clostridium sp.]MCM1204889.1 hypothetical protein [Bacteroidales bacterium]